MNNETVKDLREYAWRYFSLHADQRLKTFNFYLLLSALVVTGILATFKNGDRSPVITVALGIILAFLSYIFRGLDERNKELIKIAEQALQWLENETRPGSEGSEPHRLQLFMREQYETDRKKSSQNCFYNGFHLTYAKCFRMVFRAFGYGSIVFVILQLWDFF